MKMRELEQRTGISREVIRIMLREGLLPEPTRPTRNAAEYGDLHVRGIAAIRALQTSSRMTLKEIKRALDGGALCHSPAPESFAHLDALLAGLFGFEGAPPVALAAIEERAPEARGDAEAFRKLGMLELIERCERDGPALSMIDTRLIDIWSAIRKAGFDEAAGFSPERIGFYLEAAELVATREVEVFLDSSAGTIEEDAARMLHIALPLMTEFFGLLRLKCFMRALNIRLSSKNLEAN